MQDTPCARDDLDGAFHDLLVRLNERRSELWQAYSDATADVPSAEYDTVEQECWSVLQAGIAGIDAEQRALVREYERRLNAFGFSADSSERRVS